MAAKKATPEPQRPTQIRVGPPDLKTADRRILAIARFLYKNPILKQREAIRDGHRVEIFKLKRAVRALLSPEYEKLRNKPNSLLPELKTEKDCMDILRQFPQERMAFNVFKFESADAIARNLKPVSGVPCVIVDGQQMFGPDEYFAWFYSPVPYTTYLYGFLALAGIFAVVLYPLWPLKMRRGVYYLSLVALAFVVFMLVISIIRLVLFLVTYFVAKPGIWLFPNLYADVGFFESFQPLWSWDGQKTLPSKQNKKKRSAEKKAKAAPAYTQRLQRLPGVPIAPAGPRTNATPGAAGPSAGAVPPGAQNPQFQEIMRQAIAVSNQRSDERVRDVIRREGMKSNEELQKLKQTFFQEELAKTKQALEALQMRMHGQQAQQAQQS